MTAAMFAGPLSVLRRIRSSWKTTSITQCSRFSTCQWARTAVAKRLAESFAEDKETAPFDREFSLALDLSFDHSDHGEASEAPLAGKAPVTFEPVDLAADGVSSGLNPAMISLAGVGLWIREKAFDLGTQGRQIVRPLIADCTDDLGPAAHRVGGDKSSAQFQALQQGGDGSDLVRFLSVGLPA